MAAKQLRVMYACIGFTKGVDDNIIEVQGIDSIRELGYLNDEDLTNLCKTIRRPGSHLPNPAFGEGQIPTLAPTIPYTGIMISQRTKTNM
jgi:hypothetical protein